MRHSRWFFVLWLVVAGWLAATLAGCDPGKPVWHGVKNPAPVSAQPKEAGK